jgi:tRNA dimethylallyltransferase
MNTFKKLIDTIRKHGDDPLFKGVLLMGPTASGKTGLAIDIAKELKNAVIINADSMQIYEHLLVLTARPGEEEREKIENTPYLLDGVLKGNQKASTGWWCDKATSLIQEFRNLCKVPILVGGTGLYFKALLEGLSPIPEIPYETRLQVRDMTNEMSLEAMQRLLLTYDAEAFLYSDPQRLLRALEVVIATGSPIQSFYQQKKPLIEGKFITIGIEIERALLYEKINHRFSTMITEGAIEEVEALIKMQLDGDHPILKATGVSPLSSYLAGKCSLEEAVQEAQKQTRNYAKRQQTWMRHQMVFDCCLSGGECINAIKLRHFC